MAIQTDQTSGTSLGLLEELQVQSQGQKPAVWRPGRMQRRLLPTFAEISAVEVPELLVELFYGGDPSGRSLSARFQGAHLIQISREEQNRVSFQIGDRQLDLGDKSPGELVFGMKAEQFRRELLIEAADLQIGAGADALKVALRQLLELPLLEKRDLPAKTDELEATRKRRRLIEQELAALPQAADLEFEPADPPAVGDLLEALEAAREVDRRIMTRRLELATAFEKAARQPAANLVPASAEVLRQLEHVADEIEAEGRELEALRQRDEESSPFWCRAGIGLAFLIALLSFFVGKSLAEPFLVKVAAGLAGLAIVGILSLWYGRIRSIVQTTRQARKLRMGRLKLRERAKNLCSRVGAVADVEDLSPESIRELIDRVAKRDFSRVLKEIVAPFVDAPAELGVVRKLARALETPLARAAEVADSKIPAVPLVRATRAAMSLAQQWSLALSECARRVESGVEKKVRLQLEREMLQDSLEKLRFSERTLELAAGPKPRAQDGQNEKAARRLETRLLPLLRRHLGQLAPRGFDADLKPLFDVAPKASTNAFILLLAQLIDLREPKLRRAALGRFLVDVTLPLTAELEVEFAKIVANLPQAGTLTLAFSRPEFEASFKRSAAPLIPALITHEVSGHESPTELYSAHVDSEAPEPTAAHVLL